MAEETTTPPPEQPKPDILHFKPPVPLYRVVDANMVVEEPIMERYDLKPNTRVAVLHAWGKEGEYMIGTTRGKDGALVLQLGESLGLLEFNEKTGWVCRGLMKTNHVMHGVAKELLEKASGSFTKRLVKKAGKKG
jgi:hypothetical protein